jgi:hypothetical protein
MRVLRELEDARGNNKAAHTRSDAQSHLGRKVAFSWQAAWHGCGES